MVDEEIQIRIAAKKDAAAMVRYLDDLLEEGLDVIHPPRLTVEEEEEVLRKVEENGRSFFLIAFKNKRIVGMLNIAVGGRPYSRHAGVIGISTLAEARGQGLGTPY